MLFFLSASAIEATILPPVSPRAFVLPSSRSLPASSLSQSRHGRRPTIPLPEVRKQRKREREREHAASSSDAELKARMMLTHVVSSPTVCRCAQVGVDPLRRMVASVQATMRCCYSTGRSPRCILIRLASRLSFVLLSLCALFPAAAMCALQRRRLILLVRCGCQWRLPPLSGPAPSPTHPPSRSDHTHNTRQATMRSG